MVKNHTTINFLYFGTGNAVEKLYMMYDIKFHTQKKTLWKTEDTSEEVILAGLCLAERLYFWFGQRSGLLWKHGMRNMPMDFVR